MTWKKPYLSYALIVSNDFLFSDMNSMYKKIWFFLSLGMITVLAACGWSKVVKENSKVTFSYFWQGELSALSGQQTIVFDLPENELYQALAGMKKWETKTIAYTDIENRHDINLIYKYPLHLLQELWLPTTIGATFDISGESVVIADIISEEGIEKAVLDRNAPETIFPGEFAITILSIK